MAKAKPAWSWKIYEQELAEDRRREARAAAKAAARAKTDPAQDPASKPLPSPGAAVEPVRAAPLPDPLESPAAGRAVSPGGKISLADAPSGMESTAERWRSPVLAPRPDPVAQAQAEGMAWCRCGQRALGDKGGPVPPWFGRDCIERECPLKVAA